VFQSEPKFSFFPLDVFITRLVFVLRQNEQSLTSSQSIQIDFGSRKMNFYYLVAFFAAVLAVIKIKALKFKVKLIGYYVLASVIMTIAIPYFLLRPRNVENLQ
jgi:cyanate permease